MNDLCYLLLVRENIQDTFRFKFLDMVVVKKVGFAVLIKEIRNSGFMLKLSGG